MTVAPVGGSWSSAVEVFEIGHVGRRGDPVRQKVGRRPVVDRRRVDAEHRHLRSSTRNRAASSPYPGNFSFDASPGVSSPRYRLRSGQKRLQPVRASTIVPGAIRPCAVSKTSTSAARHPIGGVGRGLPGDVNDHRRSHQLRQRQLGGVPAGLREMHRRIQMRAAVLWRADLVGRVVVPARRHPGGQRGQLEGRGRRGPIQGGGIEGMRQIDEARRLEIQRRLCADGPDNRDAVTAVITRFRSIDPPLRRPN